MEVRAELCGEGAVGLVYKLIDHSFRYILIKLKLGLEWINCIH